MCAYRRDGFNSIILHEEKIVKTKQTDTPNGR